MTTDKPVLTVERPNPCQHWDHCDCDSCMADCDHDWKKEAANLDTTQEKEL